MRKRHLWIAAIIASLAILAVISCGGSGGGGGNSTDTGSAKAITFFSFTSPAATGTINESAKTISLTVPSGTDVQTLVATFTTSGASVKVGSTVQLSGLTPNDFTNPVAYVVTAEDNSAVTYTVTVTKAVSSAKAITSFAFSNPAATGTINESAKTISLTVPSGTDVTALVATFTTSGASVKVGSTVQVSGTTPNNFTNPVVYTITAKDASTAAYAVTVTVAIAPPSSAGITLLKTGQTTCYNDVGSIPCAGTGQDGEYQKGAASPVPRFTTGAGPQAGCVTDNLTGLMWVKTPDSIQRAWQQALDYAEGLTLCGYTDWRLPNRTELKSLADYSKNAPALPAGHPFINAQSYEYWTSTTIAASAGNSAWVVHFSEGMATTMAKNLTVYVWPVRSQP